MKFKVGVFGSNAKELSQHTIVKARQVGQSLSNHDIILVTGASAGLPYYAAYEAAKVGIEVWGYSPKVNEAEQLKFTQDNDLSIYKQLIYIPSDFQYARDIDICKKYRNVISTANCDAGIIISGRWGTLNEFTNLYDMGKIIGVLTNTGGIADQLPVLTQKISKKSKAKVIFDNSPTQLIAKVIKELKSRVHKDSF